MDVWIADVHSFANESGDKFAALRAVITRANNEASMFLYEAQRLTQASLRAGKIAARVEWIAESLLREHVALTGIRRVDTRDGGWIKLAECKSQSVECDDASLLPESLLRVKIEPNRVEIKKALVAGVAVPGCRMVDSLTESVTWSK
jgi:hypothetical protein